jgi:hypothetical protein
VQERGRFQRGLTGADDRDLSAGEHGEVVVGAGVRADLRWQFGEGVGQMREVLHSGGHDNLAGQCGAPARQADFEEPADPAHVDDHQLFQVRNLGALEPVSVGHERLQWYRQPVVGVVPAGGLAERTQCMPAVWVGQVRGVSLRLEEHAGWHRLPPQLHWQPELAEADAGGA